MTFTVAATQMACSWDRDANLRNAEDMVRQAADQGAQIILLQELDLEAVTKYRLSWNLFRDRRPETYREIMTLDGTQYSSSV